MIIRLAEEKDMEQLTKMRWDFTMEYDVSKKGASYTDFETECHSFLKSVIKNNQWYIWVAEDNKEIVSHIYINLVQKVPRPGRVTYPFAYMTNVYTTPAYRNKGIGSRVLSTINRWAKENNIEFVIVWPSEEGTNYYKKNGYQHCTEPMEYFPS
ncbi:Predicted N-acetyltransferase YhbS [Gracilibacillus ureilyticus]|uniref:Predicted N-acetyltransferase YhbS n=1 Tax=Gracilibacillus ureilyticus TaxID=531814 RepID=A0A1H9V991_9BACI|nr:GNAT family N-acetyltransferase [Gracilibacillus ureilyticus]SES18101.1 Predicted N-acetyltransferase YhbS [Gracilibacillus ureilyticus]